MMNSERGAKGLRTSSNSAVVGVAGLFLMGSASRYVLFCDRRLRDRRLYALLHCMNRARYSCRGKCNNRITIGLLKETRIFTRTFIFRSAVRM
jgi:hypothetical protein